MKGYRKILIAVNGSLDVLKQGIQLAQDEKTWVTVVKVIPPYDGDLNLTGIKNISDVLDSGVAKALSNVQKTADTEGALVKTRVEEGDVSHKIIEVAQEERCDLIITGAKRSKGLFSRVFGDNTVDRLIGHAPCPVLVVRP